MHSQEIERKFLVKNRDFIKEAYEQKRITQGFLSTVPERTVRIRTIGKKAFITVKGISNDSGTTRFEWEKEIDILEAQQLLQICEPVIIDKTRHYVKHGNHTFEIDVFQGANEGLIIAEIELTHENEHFDKPKWLGEEVTGNTRYYNSMLSQNPYNNRQYN